MKNKTVPSRLVRGDKVYILQEEILEKVEEFEKRYDLLLKGDFTPEQLLSMAHLKEEYNKIFGSFIEVEK